jgi:hypothetical protein
MKISFEPLAIVLFGLIARYQGKDTHENDEFGNFTVHGTGVF